MIDIIIPAYNAHETIRQTLLSIALQTIKDKLNIYIVNDNSKKDYSDEIKLFSYNLNIKEITLKNNVGPGLARQYGIDKSKGKYILFLDSDDVLIDCYSLEYMYDTFTNYEYDMVCGVMIDENRDGNYYFYPAHHGCLHGKLYKRKFLIDNKIRFNDSFTNEDNAFNQLFLLADPKICYIDNKIYLYRNNKNSITQKDYENYRFYDLESYINNMIWALKEGEKRKYKKEKIAALVYTSLFYSYLSYIRNFDNKNKDLIIKWSSLLVPYHKKYHNSISYDEIMNIYNQYYYGEIVPISFNDFLSFLINYKNK